jgi:uncharacterized membrane protein
MTAAPDASLALSHRSAARHGEVRLPASVAVVVAAASHAALPSQLLVEPRWVIPAVEIALLLPLIAINPTRITRETQWSRVVGLVLVGIVIAANLVSLGYLLHELTASHVSNGRELLLAALQVWLTNIVAFALVYWELDRGGAVARLPSSDKPQQRKDFLYPQDDPKVAGASEWIPTFVDYLFVSITNSTAFSPTDTLPLTTRAKALMSVQAVVAMVTSLLVIARAVNVLH